MHAIRSFRLTTRRLMILVALAAVVLTATLHGHPRPGVYFEARGWRLGAWRDETEVFSFGDGQALGYRYFLGAVARKGMSNTGLAVEWGAGKLVGYVGTDTAVLW